MKNLWECFKKWVSGLFDSGYTGPVESWVENIEQGTYTYTDESTGESYESSLPPWSDVRRRVQSKKRYRK